MNQLFDLSGRIVAITGGMGQLGIEYAAAFCENGAKVAVIDLVTEPKINNPAFETGLSNGNITPFQVDITDKQAVINTAGDIKEAMGVPGVLINNAALDSPPDAPPEEVGPFESYPESSFDKVMDVNVKGTFLCCQAFGDLMAEQGKGSIINISSTYGILSPCQDIYDFRRRKGEEFYKPVAYSVSKSAILNMTRYLATYWAKQGVRVNTLTLAGIFNHQPEEFLTAYRSRIPIGRMANPEEAVGPALFLATDASSYMTGANLIVDGGWSAW